MIGSIDSFLSEGGKDFDVIFCRLVIRPDN